jgi:hypothetical protein
MDEVGISDWKNRKVANLWYWRPCAFWRDITEYLERWNIPRWLLAFPLLRHLSSLTLLHRKIRPRSKSSSKNTVFGSERIWSWSRMQSLRSMRKSFLIASRPCYCLILLNSGDWMTLLQKWQCWWWTIVWLTSPAMWSFFSPRHDCASQPLHHRQQTTQIF